MIIALIILIIIIIIIGTHVCGTVAGSIIGTDLTYINYNGHGSGAKIAFFDMEKSKHPEYGLSYPSISKFFDCAYIAGAKLHSNSWGGAFNAYDEDTINMDAYLVYYQDFLAIFAAGLIILIIFIQIMISDHILFNLL